MRTGFLPILILGGLAAAFAVLSLVASSFLRPRRAFTQKSQPYESGIQPIRLPKSGRFAVKFYVVAMIFIVFDIEVIFLVPWAVAFRSLGLFGLVEMIVFIGLVFVAYLYVWHKGGLEWEGAERTAGAAAPVFAPLPSWVERGPGEGDLAASAPAGSGGGMATDAEGR